MFDKYFKSTRNLIKSVDEKYHSIFNFIKFSVYKDINNIYPFIDFFKLIISKEKYEKLSTLFLTRNPQNNGDSLNEDIYEEDVMKPDRIIDLIDNQIKIKKEVDFGNEYKPNEQKELGNEFSKNIENQNIIFAFSLDPFQFVVKLL